MGVFRSCCCWWCFIVLFCSVASSETQYYDAIVTEAATDVRPQEGVNREGRQSIILPPEINILDPLNPVLGTNPLLTSPCFTSKGIIGQCMSFRQCYPYFKLPDLNNWDSWILGMYDTCSYFTTQGRQMFGVCCTNPLSTPSPDQTVSTTEMPLPSIPIKNDTSQEVKQPNYPQLVNWPPPLPTHPPHLTSIPPLPTHPPSPGYPHPAFPTPTKPIPLPTTAKPSPAWPPTAAPIHTSPPIVPAPLPTSSPISSHSCGAKNGYQDQERIVGGHNADPGEWPWIAGLFNGGRQFCGGSLIDNSHILSAAHCVAHMSSWDVAKLTVRLGDYNIRINTEIKHVEKKVRRVVRHRGFDPRTLYNDVAILTLDTPITFSQNIRPICIPQSTGETYAGITATVIGWGSLRESGPQPSVLQEVSIPIWSNTECRLKYGPAAPGGIVEHMLCAGQANRDSCSGDSGGPLMVNNGKWIQVGIVSWGIGCGKGQYPGVYTRIQTFLPWIHKNLKG